MAKKLTWVIIAFLVIGLAGGYSFMEDSKAANRPLKVAMVTDVGGLGDQSFNDSAYRGLKRVEKELGAQVAVIESKKMDDYEANLRSLAEQKYDLIWAIGFLMTDAVNNVAAQYPNTNFGIIDSVVDRPNVMSVTFKEEEGSFLQGVLAGLMTKTNKIGFIGGMEFPLIIKFESGFIAGVKAVNPKAQVIVGYTGKFDDPGKGKELALTQYGQGVDIIYHASGSCGIGVIEAAKEKNKLAIGVDSDQSHLAPANVVSSMIKRVDEGVFMGSKALYDGKFKGGSVVMGLKDNGVGSAYSSGVKVPTTVLNKVKDYENKIRTGALKVPTTREEVKSFK